MSTTPSFTCLADAYEHLELKYEQCELLSRSRFDTLQATEAKCEEHEKELMACQARIGELYSEVQQWKDIAALRQQSYASMLQERDDIQLRLHAVDHAYHEFSSRARHDDSVMERLKETLRRQRQFIRTLYTSRAKKKAKPAVAVDLAKIGAERTILTWGCDCGNTGWVDITSGLAKSWNCQKCGSKHWYKS